MAQILNQGLISGEAMTARSSSRYSDRNLCIDTQMDSSRSAIIQNANMKTPIQHLLKRKSGEATSSPDSPHLSRLATTLNKALAVSSPLTPLSTACTPVTEVPPFNAKECVDDFSSNIVTGNDCEDMQAETEGFTESSLHCRTPIGEPDADKQFGQRHVKLFNESPAASPCGGLARQASRLHVSEADDDAALRDFVNPFLRSISMPNSFDTGLMPVKFNFAINYERVFSCAGSLQNEDPNTCDGFSLGTLKFAGCPSCDDGSLSSLSQDTIMSQEVTQMDGAMLAAVQKNYLPPSIVCADDASQTSGLRLELDVSSKALDVKSGDPSHAMFPRPEFAHRLSVLGGRRQTWNFSSETGLGKSPFRKRSRAHSPSRAGQVKSPNRCATPTRNSHHAHAAMGFSSPCAVLAQTPSAPTSNPPATPMLELPQMLRLRRGLSLAGFSPCKSVVEKDKKLPTFQDECVLDCVSVDTVRQLCMGGFRDMYDKVMIIDCRFDYEYDGGHVESNEWLSVHHVPPHRKDKMEELLYFRGDKSKLRVDNDRVCVIFHCEFSKQRGPKMMSHIRSIDRQQNHAQYPLLYYPELYVMKGGYKAFFLEPQTTGLCFPMMYTPMLAEEHKETCKRQLQLMNESKKGGKSKGRSTLMMMNAVGSP